MNTEDKIKLVDDVLSRGVGEFIDPADKFKEKLIAKIKGQYSRDIVIKFGVDPTRPDIHLGHAVVFKKLKLLQDLGCKVVFLIGDFTATIGDPTGKSKVRPEIAFEELKSNVQSFLVQAEKVLDVQDSKKYSWINNALWFYSLTNFGTPKLTSGSSVDFDERIGEWKNYLKGASVTQDLKNYYIVSLAGLMWALKHVTFSQLIERDMFQDRIKKGNELFMHEMLYPVLQGTDSLAVDHYYGSCDLEIGGTDQTFNMLMGRQMQKVNKKVADGSVLEQQAVMTIQLLEGLDGKEKMSKSLDNYVAITDKPNDMFGKIMSVPDTLITKYFKLCTELSFEEIEEIEEEIEKGENPKDFKVRLASEIVRIYHGADAADEAQHSFENTFKKGGIPEDALLIEAPKGQALGLALKYAKVVESSSEFARLIKEGAISEIETDEKIEDRSYAIERNINLRIGKKRFVKIIVK